MMKLWKGALALTLAGVLFQSALAQPVNSPPGPPIKCTNKAIYAASSSGSTEMVAAVTGRTIYVCGYTVFSGGTSNVKFVSGTATNCASTAADMTPAYAFIAQTGIVDGSSFNRGLIAPVSNALCINSSAAVAVSAIVYYSQF